MPWLAVHPLVGEAIMSTIAIALARDKGLDIVTSSGELHHALVIQNEKEAFNSILLNNIKPPEPAAKIDITDKANQLSEVFMLTSFDLSKLTPNQIGELVGNGHDLRNFKKALIPIAESLPDIPNLKEREKRLKDAGREIIDEWEKHKKSLPKYALDAIWEAGKEIKMPDVCQSLMAGATGYALGSGIGLTIGFMCYTGYKIWDKFERELHHPYQFLSKIEKAGATLAFQASPDVGVNT
jgi:hypothetical protein